MLQPLKKCRHSLIIFLIISSGSSITSTIGIVFDVHQAEKLPISKGFIGNIEEQEKR